MKRVRLATILCACVLTACGPSRLAGREVSWTECRDQIDNDGDGRIDCDDPDCRAVPCADASVADAATHDPDGSVEDAAADANVTDAHVETCAPACSDGEVCRDQRCVIPLPTELRMEVLSMDGPGAIVIGLWFPTCADQMPNMEDCGPLGGVWVCTGCPPDPYVRVDIETPRPGGGLPIVTTVGHTRVVSDAESATWSDEDRWDVDLNPVRVQEGDQVLLVARDHDDTDEMPPDDTLFACSIKATNLRMGPQRCISKPSSAFQSNKPEFEIWIDVRPP